MDPGPFVRAMVVGTVVLTTACWPGCTSRCTVVRDRYYLGRGTPAGRQHEARQIYAGLTVSHACRGSGPSGERRGVALSTLRTQTVLLVVSERRRN